MTDATRTKVLVGVLAVLVIFFVRGRMGKKSESATMDAVTRSAQINSRGRSAATRRAAESEGGVVALELDRLSHRPAEYSPGRDLFQFHRPAPTPVARPKPTPKPKPKAEQNKKAAQNRKPPKPKPPAIDLEFLGSFGPEGRRIAVFTDKKDILNALEGDVLSGKFIVGPIGYESVEMSFVGFPDAPPKRMAAGG